MILPGLSKKVFTAYYMFWLTYGLGTGPLGLSGRPVAFVFNVGLYTHRTHLAVFLVVVVVFIVTGATGGVGTPCQ